MTSFRLILKFFQQNQADLTSSFTVMQSKFGNSSKSFQFSMFYAFESGQEEAITNLFGASKEGNHVMDDVVDLPRPCRSLQ